MIKIVDIKNPVLRKRAKGVKKIDKKVKQLISEMKDCLLSQEDPEGVGLAAPQVGKSLRIFIMHYPDEGVNLKTVINPEILETVDPSVKGKKKKYKKEKDILEGCLSLPYYYGPIKRSGYVKLRYMNEKGESKVEEFYGFPAHIVQHEVDHLNGKIFIDYILTESSPLYFIKGDEYEEVEL